MNAFECGYYIYFVIGSIVGSIVSTFDSGISVIFKREILIIFDLEKLDASLIRLNINASDVHNVQSRILTLYDW